jgi:ribonuclease BN (tRNA processing enzyme)
MIKVARKSRGYRSTDMKLTILGSGTVVPDGDRNSAGYFIQAGGARLMLDCGAGTLHALARYRLPWETITHIFVSHFHVDHVGELASLFFAFKYGMSSGRREPLLLVGPRGLDRVMRGLEEAFGPGLFEPGFPVHLKMLEPGEQINLAGDLSLSVAKTPHNEESLAARIARPGRSICYTGDTASSDELAEFFKGASLLISECSFERRRPEIPHLSIEEAAELAARASAARLVVTHFYFEVNEAELYSSLSERYSGQIIIGRDGLALEV